MERPTLRSEALEPRYLLTDPLSVLEVTEAVSDIVYDKTNDTIWASVPDQNLIAAIDPYTGTFTPAVNTAFPVDVIDVSDDGTTLWTASNTIGRINRIDLATSTVAPGFFQYNPNVITIQDLEVLPGNPLAVAAAGPDGTAILLTRVRILDVTPGVGDGVTQRPSTAPGNNIDFNDDGSIAYTFDPSQLSLVTYQSVSAVGLSTIPVTPPTPPFLDIPGGSGEVQFSNDDYSGIATAPSDMATLTDANAVFDSRYTGRRITITDGVGQGQTRTIMDIDPTQTILTLNAPWTIAIDTTSEYNIDGGTLYFDTGEVYDETSRLQTGMIPLSFPQIPSEVDDQSYFVDGMGTVRVVSHETNLEIDQVPLVGFTVSRAPLDPIRLADDSNRVAFRTADQVFIVEATEFAPQCDTVVQSGDTGFGTLRQAIQCANAMPGAQRIRFDGLGGVPFNLRPTSPLPAITDRVFIDGMTNPGFAGMPIVVIDGSLAGNNAVGLNFTQGGSDSIVESIAVHSFDSDGILIRGSGLTINNTWVGTNATGTADLGNGRNGIRILNSKDNTITGSVISGNIESGIAIEGATSTGNVVTGNLIGTDATGMVRIRNRDTGVELSAATGNTIGGTTAADMNVISGGKRGVRIRQGATDNTILGNFIGTDITGTVGIRNTRGISIEDSDGNTIGPANVISGNTNGVFFSRSDDNIVQGNLLGTNPVGDAAVPNTRGVQITSGNNNLIGDNVISGNRREGVRITRADSVGNAVQGNMIGTNAAGDTALPNQTGIWMTNTAGPNVIGGRMPGEGNTISGNSVVGVQLYSSGHLVEGNHIGTDLVGVNALPNQTGVFIRSASVNTIGGTLSGARNLISGNEEEGVYIVGAAAAGNRIEGNYIGTDVSGSFAVPNKNGVIIQAPANTVGGASLVAGNLISGNTLDGVTLQDADATGNVVAGNVIGLNATGDAALANQRGGVLIENAPANTIGGTLAGAANVISGNNFQGIKVVDPGAIGNTIQGNFIGVDAAGVAFPNSDGVRIADGAERTLVGGSAPGAGNTIAFNTRRGIFVTANNTAGSLISRNSIHDNGDLGILLGTATRTLNDVDDPDLGANNLQNFPVIATAAIVQGNLSITYSVPSTTLNSAYPLTVEFFRADTAGEGQTFIGADTYAAPGMKTASFPAAGIANGTPIVATAIDANGNTSEFSDPKLIGAPLLAAGGEAAGGDAASLTAGQLNGLLAAAIGRLGDAGLSSGLFSDVEVRTGDLPGAILGLAAGNVITIDVNAAGHGWFVDTTPLDDSEFIPGSGLSTLDSRLHIDLLTVVMHELGHTAGLTDLDHADAGDDLMHGWLEAGVRRTSLAGSMADAVLADW